MGILRDVIRDVVKPVLVDVSDRWWENPWHSVSPIKLVVEFDGTTQFAFKFKAPSTSTLKIYDGDGTMTEVAGNNTTLVTHTTAYAAPGTYYFYVEGDWADLTQITFSFQEFVSGSIDRWDELVNLTSIGCSNTGMTGDVSNLLGLPLFVVNLSNTEVTGDISAFRGISPLIFDISSPYLTFDDLTAWTWNGAVLIKFGSTAGSFTSEMVDACLETLKTCTNCTITINTEGTYGRTFDSDSAVLTMIGNGDKLAVREDSNSLTLGAELHVGPDAISDSNGNEADAITGWNESGLNGTGANVFVSQEVVVAVGSSAFKLDCNDTPTANAGINQSYTVEVSDVIRTSVKWRHSGTGGKWRMLIEALTSNLIIHKSVLSFIEVASYSVAGDTEYKVLFSETSTTNDGGVYIDDLSIKKVTLPE